MQDCGTILIVDSDDASRLTAVQVAVRLGYDARPTPTADELVERLGPERPALAIVEVELPGAGNGLDVMRQLHETFDDALPVTHGTERDGVIAHYLSMSTIAARPHAERDDLAATLRTLLPDAPHRLRVRARRHRTQRQERDAILPAVHRRRGAAWARPAPSSWPSPAPS